MTNPVIAEVCQNHQVSVEDFFSRKLNRKLWECRKEAAQILRDRGNSWPTVARLLRRQRHTVRYWLEEGYRQRRALRNSKRKPVISPIWSDPGEAAKWRSAWARNTYQRINFGHLD